MRAVCGLRSCSSHVHVAYIYTYMYKVYLYICTCIYIYICMYMYIVRIHAHFAPPPSPPPPSLPPLPSPPLPPSLPPSPPLPPSLTVELLQVVLGEHVVLFHHVARVTVAVKEMAEDVQCPLLALPPLQVRPVLLVPLQGSLWGGQRSEVNSMVRTYMHMYSSVQRTLIS